MPWITFPRINVGAAARTSDAAFFSNAVGRTCTAPLMGAAIGFALSQRAILTFTIFTSLVFGLALPYLALTLVPGWTSKLQRPGRWMETLKQLTSVPLFLAVVWLVWVYGRLSGSTAADSTDHVATPRRAVA
jgi:thiol:disulfide interchange protein DsbD